MGGVDISILLMMAGFALMAGFVDAVVGGGGLIQMPALLINFPSAPLPSIVGTSKISGFVGTTLSAYRYTRVVKIEVFYILAIGVMTYIAAHFGSVVLTMIDASKLKPIILVILILIAIYTFFKKDLGNVVGSEVKSSKKWILGILLGGIVGFYDGIFGPGTGSFLVFGFVLLLKLEFVKASAYAKIVNCISNLASLMYLVPKGFYMLEIAICMAIANGTGSYIGAKYALAKGNTFVRKVFLFVVVIMIARYGYDIFF